LIVLDEIFFLIKENNNNNKQIHEIDSPCQTGFVDWWEVKKFRERAITLKLGSGGLWFLCSTLSPIKVYLPIKFHADIFCSHWDMFHTKFKYEKTKQRAITLKLGSGGLWSVF